MVCCTRVAAGAAMALFATGVACAASFTPLGQLPGAEYGSTGSLATRISSDGSTVVGTSGSFAGTHPFRWTLASGIVDLGDLPGGGSYTEAWGVSGDGTVVVGQSFGAAGQETFRWTPAGGMAGLGDLPGGPYYSSGRSVSADGSTVVGTGTDGYTKKAFRWTASDGMVGLGSWRGNPYNLTEALDVSADGGVIVGAAFDAGGMEPFRWTADTGLVSLGFAGRATAVSDDGQFVVGWGPDGEAFRWSATGGRIVLGQLPGGNASSGASGVSSDGQVVVGSSSWWLGDAAFYWTEAGGMRRLADVLIGQGATGLEGWTLFEAYDVSGDGTRIIGSGWNPRGQREVYLAVVAPVPLPPGAVLVVTAFAALLGSLRRRGSTVSGASWPS